LQQLKSYLTAVNALLLSHGQKLHDDITIYDSFIFIFPNKAELFFYRINAIFNRIVATSGLPATTIHG